MCRRWVSLKLSPSLVWQTPRADSFRQVTSMLFLSPAQTLMNAVICL